MTEIVFESFEMSLKIFKTEMMNTKKEYFVNFPDACIFFNFYRFFGGLTI